jgi:hypothetical protein
MSRGGGSHPTPLPTGPESLDVHRAIVGACDRFEAEWRAGHKPGVERAAAGVPTPMRGEVRRALAELEAELEGESASPLDTTGGTTAPIEILRPLAAGGMGQVSVAYDPEVNRVVALKEILPRGGTMPSCGSGFCARRRLPVDWSTRELSRSTVGAGMRMGGRTTRCG